jgi:hypothetical protein
LRGISKRTLSKKSVLAVKTVFMAQLCHSFFAKLNACPLLKFQPFGLQLCDKLIASHQSRANRRKSQVDQKSLTGPISSFLPLSAFSRDSTPFTWHLLTPIFLLLREKRMEIPGGLSRDGIAAEQIRVRNCSDLLGKAESYLRAGLVLP